MASWNFGAILRASRRVTDLSHVPQRCANKRGLNNDPFKPISLRSTGVKHDTESVYIIYYILYIIYYVFYLKELEMRSGRSMLLASDYWSADVFAVLCGVADDFPCATVAD